MHKLLVNTTLVGALFLGSTPNSVKAITYGDLRQKLDELIRWFEGNSNTTKVESKNTNVITTPPPTTPTIPRGWILEPGASRNTPEINVQQPKVTIYCNGKDVCALKLKVMQQQTSPDGYTFFKVIREESVSIPGSNSIDLVIETLKGPFMVSATNVGTRRAEFDYKVEGSSGAKPNQPVPIPKPTQTSPTNTLVPNKNPDKVIDLGRIKFNQIDAIYLQTDSLTSGNYMFGVVPSSKRSELIIMPIGNDNQVRIEHLKKGVSREIVSITPNPIKIRNPIVDEKDEKVIIHAYINGEGKVFVFGY